MLRFLLITIVIANSSYAGHYLAAGYDLLTSAKLEDNFATDGTNTSSGGTSEFEFEPGFSIGYEYRNASANSWGASFGVEYHSEKQVEEVSFSGETAQATGNDNATIQITHLYFNLIYRWDVFYIPFGLNVASVKYTPPSTFIGEFEDESSLGFNFALGWELGDNFLIEYGARSTTYSLEYTNGSTVVDYGEGALVTTTLSLKYKLF